MNVCSRARMCVCVSDNNIRIFRVFLRESNGARVGIPHGIATRKEKFVRTKTSQFVQLNRGPDENSSVITSLLSQTENARLNAQLY